jgi:hypothetical protein
MFQGGFSVLRCAHTPEAQTSVSATASNPCNLARQIDFPDLNAAPKSNVGLEALAND